MRSSRPFITCLQISRCISSSSVCSNIYRESKFMRKIISGSRKSKRKWYDTNSDLRSVNINPTDKLPCLSTRRRMMMRDKLFMEHITDMMSMGEVSDIMRGNLEITHVKITPDFKYVNVFYIPSNDDATIDEEALQKSARIIRHELSQLRVIGIVPPIQFVQNKQYFAEKEVERRLAMINFEEDSDPLWCDKEFGTSAVSNIDQTLQEELVASRDSEADEFYIRLPVMRHDVLGLDHHKIMSQITSLVSKAKKTARRRMLDANTTNEYDNIDKSPRDPVSKEVEFLTREEQRKIFSDFLIKRRREEQRRHKLKRSNKVLYNFEQEIDNEDSDYEDDDIEAYIDDFEDETRK